MENTPVLAFDCACFGASVSLRVGGRTETRLLTQGNQASGLVTAIDTLLREAGISYSELGSIVSTVGPGSFTGLRIGLAALHGFVLVHHTPIKLLSTLEAMAWHIAAREGAPAQFLIAIRAGKGELYAQPFQHTGGLPSATGDISLFPETTESWPAPCYGNHLPEDDQHFLAAPDTATLCAIAHHLPIATLADAMPLYIRPPDAVIPAPPAWLAG